MMGCGILQKITTNIYTMVLNRLFVDTGPILAAYRKRDQYHEKARCAWQELSGLRPKLYISEHVFDEVVTLLGRQSGYRIASDFSQSFLGKKDLEWLQTSKKELQQAGKIVGKFAGQQLSFTDAISIVLMKREKINTVFSFDEDFRFAGFRMFPNDFVR